MHVRHHTDVLADVASFPHPAIQLQYMEICVRYYSFFEANPQFVNHALENFVTFVHHNHVKVRTRSWYLFHRFVKHVRQHIGDIAENVIRALGDLLPIKAELPEETSDNGDMSSDENEQTASARFSSQLYLYEAVGCICSIHAVPVNNQVLYVRSVITPLFTDLETHLGLAKSGDERATLQVHHLVMALGTLARGFSDWSPASTSPTAHPPAKEVSEEFTQTSEAILVALETLNSSLNIRTAARFAFSRLIGVLGSRILPQLPRWIDGLLSQTSSKDEMALFLRLLDQVVYGFKSEIFEILNTLLTPFLQRVFTGIGEPAAGTDDEIQLAELKREYLNFLLIILNNDLASVLVSESKSCPLFSSLILTHMLMAISQPIRLRRRHLHHRTSCQGYHRLPNRQTRLRRPHPHGLHLGRPRHPISPPTNRHRPPHRSPPTNSSRLRPLHDRAFLPALLGHPHPTHLRPQRRAGKAGPCGSGKLAKGDLCQDGAGVSYMVERGGIERNRHGCGDGGGVSGGVGQFGSEGVQAVLSGTSYISQRNEEALHC